MFRELLLRTITTLPFASPFLSVSWAQDKAQPPTRPRKAWALQSSLQGD